MNAPLPWTPHLLNLSHFPISHLPRCLIRILPPTPTAICLWFKYQEMQTSNQTLTCQIGSFCTLAVNTEHLKPLKIIKLQIKQFQIFKQLVQTIIDAHSVCKLPIVNKLCQIFTFALLTFLICFHSHRSVLVSQSRRSPWQQIVKL